MEGQRILTNLSEEVKDHIISKYGSLQVYYDTIVKLTDSYYKAFMTHGERRKAAYEEARFRYAQELESWGVVDGLDVFDEISGDADQMRITGL